jgi:hypothetical protein
MAMLHLDPTAEAVVVLSANSILSLIVAWITLRILRGSAQVKQKGVRLGGAAAMFVVTFFLLNRSLPDIRNGIFSESLAAQSQNLTTTNEKGTTSSLELYVSPDQQVVSERDLKSLDRNKYAIDEGLGVAVLKSENPAWIVGQVAKIERPEIEDVPAVAFSLGAAKAMSGMETKLGDNPFFAIQTKHTHSVTISKESVVGGIRADLNHLLIKMSYDKYLLHK